MRPEERSTAAAAYSTVITILYFPFGVIAAAGALFAMIGEFLSIIGIPCGIVWFKALPAIFMPVDKICVPKAVADEIARIKAGDTVRRYKGETREPETRSAERHFAEDPDETLPPMSEVRQYDDDKLLEIVCNAAMYRASLVEECRREIDIRSKSAKFTEQVRAMDNDKLHEILASPQLYAEELIYACTLEQAERRRIWREEQAKEEEKLRLRREQEEKAADSGTGGMAEDAGTIYVHVCGAVLRPGVYELAAGSRVYEAVQAAGGFAENAEESYVNQAQEVPDGAKLVIPTKEEAEAIVSKDSGRPEAEGKTTDSGVQPGIVLQEEGYSAGSLKEAEAGKPAAGGDRVNINTASLEELCKIPGIGTTRAAAIVSYREDHGSFKSPEEIMQVSGIKEGTYEKIKDSISVK